MISVDINKVKFEGPDTLVRAELTILLKACKEQFSEEEYRRCVERAELSEEEIHERTKENIRKLIEIFTDMEE